MAKMLRTNDASPAGKASSVNRLISPAELQLQTKISKLARSVQQAVTDASHPKSTAVPIRWSQRIAQREGSQASLFFSLPTELRSRILDYACAGVRLRFHHANTKVGTAYQIKNETDYSCRPDPYIASLRPGLPAWMLLSKQMLVGSL